jgi:hypothetical protein
LTFSKYCNQALRKNATKCNGLYNGNMDDLGGYLWYIAHADTQAGAVVLLALLFLAEVYVSGRGRR